MSCLDKYKVFFIKRAVIQYTTFCKHFVLKWSFNSHCAIVWSAISHCCLPCRYIRFYAFGFLRRIHSHVHVADVLVPLAVIMGITSYWGASYDGEEKDWCKIEELHVLSCIMKIYFIAIWHIEGHGITYNVNEPERWLESSLLRLLQKWSAAIQT